MQHELMLRRIVACVLLAICAVQADAMSVAVVQATAPTSTGTLDITDSSAGFSSDLKAAICEASAATATHTSTAHAVLSMGMATNNSGTQQYTQGFLSQDAVTTTNTGSNSSSTQAFLQTGTSSSPTTVMEADLSSWLSNGIRLNFTKVSGTAIKINCLLIGGSDVQAKVLIGDFPGTGNNDLVLAHGLSGAPTALIVRSSSTTPSWFGLGFWDGTNTAGLNFGSTNNNAGASVQVITSTSLVIPGHLSATDAYTVQAVDATNVTLRNTGNATGTRTAAVLALRGVTAKAGFFTTATSTGSTNKITGMSVNPSAAIFLGNRQTSVGSTIASDAAGALSLGFVANRSGTTIQQASASSSEDHGASPTVNKNQVSGTEAIRILDIAGAADYEGAVDAFGTGTISINTTNAAASALEVAYLAFGASVTIPAFTSNPTIGTRTTSAIPFNLTSDTTGTVYAARFTDGTSLGSVTCDQLEAQTASGAVQYANEAVVATVADTLTFTGISNGTKTDGAFCIEDASGNDSPVYTSGDAIDMLKLPAWNTLPTCAASSASAIGCNFQLDGPGDVFGVACKKDLNDSTTAPNVVSTACSASLLAAANKAVTGADSLSLTGITLPVADVFVVGRYVAGTNTSRVDQLDKVLNAPTGYAPYVELGTLGTSSANPVNKYNARPIADVAPSDYATVSTTSPDNYPVEMYSNGGINIDGPPTPQTVRLRYYDTSAGDWHAEASPSVEHEVWVNWQQAVCNPQGYRSGAIKINTNPGTVALSGYAADPQNSALTYALQSGSLAARSLNGSTGDLTGNIQNTEVEAGVDGVVRITNAADLYCDLPITQYPINTVTVPTCTSLAACESQLASVWLTGSETYALSLSVAGGDVIGQSPVAGNQAEPNSNVLITYSRGLVSVTAQVDGYQLTVTPLYDTTAYAAALRRNACLPSAVQLAAGTDCMGGAALATHSIAAPAGVTTSLSLTDLELPRYDVYVVTQDDTGGDWTQVLPLLNRQKLPESGRQYIQVAP